MDESADKLNLSNKLVQAKVSLVALELANRDCDLKLESTQLECFFANMKGREYGAAFQRLVELHSPSLGRKERAALNTSAELLELFSSDHCDATQAMKAWAMYFAGIHAAIDFVGKHQLLSVYYEQYHYASTLLIISLLYGVDGTEFEPSLIHYHVVVCRRIQNIANLLQRNKKTIEQVVTFMWGMGTCLCNYGKLNAAILVLAKLKDLGGDDCYEAQSLQGSINKRVKEGLCKESSLIVYGEFLQLAKDLLHGRKALHVFCNGDSFGKGNWHRKVQVTCAHLSPTLMITVGKTLVKIEKDLLQVLSADDGGEPTNWEADSYTEKWQCFFISMKCENYEAAFDLVVELHHSNLEAGDMSAVDASAILLLLFSNNCFATGPKIWARYFVGSWLAIKGLYSLAMEWLEWSLVYAKRVEYKLELDLVKYHASICERLKAAATKKTVELDAVLTLMHTMGSVLSDYRRFDNAIQVRNVMDGLVAENALLKNVVLHLQLAIYLDMDLALAGPHSCLSDAEVNKLRICLEQASKDLWLRQMHDIESCVRALYSKFLVLRQSRRYREASQVIDELNDLPGNYDLVRAAKLLMQASIETDLQKYEDAINKSIILLECIQQHTPFARMLLSEARKSKLDYLQVKPLMKEEADTSSGDLYQWLVAKATEIIKESFISGEDSTAQELVTKFYNALEALSEDLVLAGNHGQVLQEDRLQKFVRYNILHMEDNFGPSSNKNSISYNLTRTELKYNRMEELLLNLNPPNIKHAIVWAERGRVGALRFLHMKENILSDSCYGDSFHKDEDTAWQDIQSICDLAGDDTIFIMYSRSGNSYFLHSKEDPQFSIINICDIYDEAYNFNNIFLEADVSKRVLTLQGETRPFTEERLVVKLEILYQMLIAPYTANLERIKPRYIVIIPTEELSKVPFSALRKPETADEADEDNEDKADEDNPDEADEDKNPFLIQRYAISTIPSLGYFKSCKSHCRRSKTALVVGNPYNESVDPLDNANEELEFVADSLQEAGLTVTLLQNKAATKKQLLFNKSLPSYDWIHMAGHAIPGRFQVPKMVMASEDDYCASTSEETGSTRVFYNTVLAGPNFTAMDISCIHKLNAGVVVLSACGSGSDYGVVGRLSKVLHFSGVSNTVVTLWPVQDKSTLDLIKAFYSNLKDGDTIAVALQEAMKSMLKKKTNTGNSEYSIENWAAFMITGIPKTRIDRSGAISVQALQESL